MGFSLLFYLFSSVLVMSSVIVVSARNTVHSVLFLILTFLNAAGLILLLGAEFIAMSLVIVYVGAVAVLFLFVVMMLNIPFKQARKGITKYKGVSFLSFLLLMGEIGLGLWFWKEPNKGAFPIYSMDYTRGLGNVLYTDSFFIFQLAGVILLVAMVGGIVLALPERPRGRRQSPQVQLSRSPKQTLELKDMKPGKGVKVR